MPRGRPRKPTKLHVLQGTLNATRHRDRIGEPESAGRPVPPQKLGTRERELWVQFIDSASWLGFHDGPTAFLWVTLFAEYEQIPSKMNAARISQLRAVGGSLGLDPSSRSNLAGAVPTRVDSFDEFLMSRNQKADEFFDD